MKSFHFSRFQLAVHFASWIPLSILVIDWVNGNLTVNPIQALEQRTGQYAIVWLLLSLACTPFNTVFGFRPALKVRRALGLYAFFYASLHFLIFFGLDYGFNLGFVLADFGQKRFIIIGLASLLILLPLAITSTRGWMKRLGKAWHQLHRLVYPTAVLVVIHYIWSVKADYRQPVLYGGILLLLFVLRLPPVRRWVSIHRLQIMPRTGPPARNKLTGTDPDPGLK